MRLTARLALFLAVLTVAVVLPVVILAQSASMPDLTVIDNYPNPFGTTCGMEGKGKDRQTGQETTLSPEKQASNRLKNRFHLPPNGVFTPTTIEDIIALIPASLSDTVKANDPRNARAVSVVGYVRDVFGGAEKNGESCNCYATGIDKVDAHIDIVTDPNQPDSTRKLVVEVTERVRRLAAQGLLKAKLSNREGVNNNDWSTPQLRSLLLGRWVRFDGWLFYDMDHHTGSWRSDPDNTTGEKNWRATAWEVHPVMGIEVLPGDPRKTAPASGK